MTTPSYPQAMSDHDWEAESDFHTLSRAEEVKSDPTRHAKAIAHGKAKIAADRKVVARGQTIGIKSGDETNVAKGYRKL